MASDASPLEKTATRVASGLLAAGHLRPDQHAQLLQIVAQTGERVEEAILELGFMTEPELLRALAVMYRTNFVSADKLSTLQIPRSTIELIPVKFAETRDVLAVVFDAKNLVMSVVTPTPTDKDLIESLKLASGAREVKAFVCRPSAVRAGIRKHYHKEANAFSMLDRAAVAIHTTMRAYDPMALELAVPGEPYPQTATSQPMAPTAPPFIPTSRQAIEISQPPAPTHGPVSSPFVTSRGMRFPERMIRNERPEDSPELSLDKPAQTQRSAPPAPMPAAAPRASQGPDGGQAADKKRRGALTPSGIPSQPPRFAIGGDVFLSLLNVLISLLEAGRHDLRGHSAQVARLSRKIAERLGLDEPTTTAVVAAGYVHDLGKMGKFHLTALNVGEYDGHKVAAQKACPTPARLLEPVELPTTTTNAVSSMYERYDGGGFPDGLSGKEIPLAARILSVIDTYEDLTQNPRNPYRKLLTAQEATAVLGKYKGTIFDPNIVDLLKATVLGQDVRDKLLASRYSALVVDADPEETTVLELRMVEQGFDVRTARGADQARQVLRTGTVDIVVADLDLAQGDGIALLEEARRESWGKDLPWVVYTSRKERSDAQRAFDLGVLDFVIKPAQTDVFVARLMAMLGQRAAAGAARRGVSGSLREMAIPDLIQVLYHAKKTGKLSVESAGQAGEIHVHDGHVVHALWKGLRGEDAFYAMLTLADGEFSLDPGFVPTQRTIHESSEGLLLEGMRRMDEGLV